MKHNNKQWQNRKTMTKMIRNDNKQWKIIINSDKKRNNDKEW